MTSPLVIIGCGGFGRETHDVLDAVNAIDPKWELLGYVDDAPTKVNLDLVHRRGANASTFSEKNTPDAYEKLLIDAISGDQTLFARTDEIAASWEFFSPILTHWRSEESTLRFYEGGGNGPSEADKLIEADGLFSKKVVFCPEIG